ncbi:epstein-barr virus ebna-1-like protein [Hordeum vulgare]|nr:epstein-barr virus ebna-1-like protein [Hordeum vulgare]
MKGNSSPNFVMPFVSYTIGKYVCPTTQQYVDNRYLGIVRNVETIKSTNFGQLMLGHLMASLRKCVNVGENLEGNLPLLQTWYYEKWRVHQLDSTISYASRLRPLIQNWSEEKAKKVDNIIENNYLGVGEYVEDLMRPFIPAQDGTLAKLKTGAQVVDAAIELMRHDEPTDTRDDQLVYIERVADVVKHERDGRIEKCYEDALAGISGTTQGTSYLKHDMANIDEFRRELPVVLVDSPYNKMKYMKRFKQYHARLSDAAAVEGDEDASS